MLPNDNIQMLTADASGFGRHTRTPFVLRAFYHRFLLILHVVPCVTYKACTFRVVSLTHRFRGCFSVVDFCVVCHKRTEILLSGFLRVFLLFHILPRGCHVPVFCDRCLAKLCTGFPLFHILIREYRRLSTQSFGQISSRNVSSCWTVL